MIPSTAVDAFLSRELDSHLWIKRLSSRQLDEAIARLRPAPRLKVPLRKHQKACFLLGVSYPKFCFWLDMGTGKTLLSFALLSYWFQVGWLKRAIIFVTSDKAFLTWERQLKRFGIDLPMTALEGSSEKKWQRLQEFGDGLVLIPYPGAVAMTTSTVKRKGKKRVQWELDKEYVLELSKWAEGLVFDESTRLGNHQSLTYKLAHLLKKQAKVRYALSGRPFGRDPTMLWPQCMIIDDGETLGETLGMFREAFYDAEERRYGPKHIRKHAKDYRFRKSMKPRLSKMLQHRSITYSADECIDLPKVVAEVEYVTLPEETRAYYKRFVEQLIAAKGNFREVESVFLRLRQLSSGFVGLKDDETGEKAEVIFDQNPKLDRTLELISELPEGRKAIVWYDFTLSGRTLVERLKKELGISSIWLWSGTKDGRKELERFGQQGGPEVAVINHRVGAMSLDGLQEVANYEFYYESPISVIDREQAQKRLERDGQKHTIFRYDMVVRRTVDERILAFHREGADLFRSLMKDPSKVLLL